MASEAELKEMIESKISTVKSNREFEDTDDALEVIVFEVEEA